MSIKYKIPLGVVKAVCIAAALTGIFFIAAGNWVAGLCMLFGSWQFEKNLYRCLSCGHKLDIKMPVFKRSRCPHCSGFLRRQAQNANPKQGL